MIVNYLFHIYQIFLNKIEKFTARKNWQLELTILIPIIALFFSFPSYERLFTENMVNWNALFQQAAHPFENANYDPVSHQAKMTFRLFVPLLVRLFHLNVIGVILLEILFGIATVYLFIKAILKITKDKVTAVILTLAFSSTAICKNPFNDIVGFFDGIALFFLVIPIVFTNPIAIFCAVFSAAWIDERSLIASTLIFIWILITKNNYSKTTQIIALFTAWIAYVLTRFFLIHYFHLVTHTGAVGLDILLNQLNNAPLGIWTGLEGFWLLVILSFIVLLKQDKKAIASLFLVGMSVIILVALSVSDITRSMIYLFPSIFLALSIISSVENEKNLRYIATFVLLLCMLLPQLTVGGYNLVNWQFPLPLQMLRYLTQ